MYYNKYSYWQIRHIFEEWGYSFEKMRLYKDRIGHYIIRDKDGKSILQHITLTQLRVMLTKIGVPANYDPKPHQKKAKSS